jgi:hypothetical protein
MSSPVQKISDLIREFALSQSDTFEAGFLYEFVDRKLKKAVDEDRVYDLACQSDFLFEDLRDLYADWFIPRHVAFKGAEFLVTPLPEEVEGGFLLPGHRLMPFISRDVLPWNAAINLPEGGVAAKRQVDVSQEIAHRCLLFMGEVGALDYLFYDDDDNMQRMQQQEPVRVTVMDLADFYTERDFRAGDSLLFTVEDWLKGIFSVRHVKAAHVGNDMIRAGEWIQALNGGFEECMVDAGIGHDCYEQMAQMLWFAESEEESAEVLSNPPLTMASYFNMQDELQLETAGGVTFFWPKGESMDARLMNSMAGGGPEAESELDAFFCLLGLSLDESDVEAYMRDALAKGTKDPMVVLGRVIDGRTLIFPRAEDQQRFEDLWTEKWDALRADYNVFKDTHREVRSVFLELNDQCLAVLRELDQHADDGLAVMEHPSTLELGRLSGLIHGVLEVCNREGEDIGEFKVSLDAMKRDISRAIATLGQELSGARREEVAPTEKVYQLKISLKGAKPPIWRRVLVSSGIELEALHDIIQSVFGWTNSHLHQFIKGRTCYEPNPEESWGMMDCESSHNIRLQSLLRKEKDKIEYEYDFGDSWKHEVLLEKVMKAEPDQELPICIKGMRACPPEDCGGLWGYYHMLETLDGPKCDEKDRLLDWLGGPIDPDAFDLEEANRRLSCPF